MSRLVHANGGAAVFAIMLAVGSADARQLPSEPTCAEVQTSPADHATRPGPPLPTRQRIRSVSENIDVIVDQWLLFLYIALGIITKINCYALHSGAIFPCLYFP